MTRPVPDRAAACPGARLPRARRRTPGRRRVLLVLPVLLVGLIGLAGPATAPPAAAADEPATPLAVTMDTLTPSTIPERGRIRITGAVTNRSEDTWTDLQVYLFISSEPITSRGDLADAVDTEESAFVGQRVFTAGLYDEIGDLEPGGSASYSLSVPRSAVDITGEPGVYWVGAHVLGAVDGARDDFADGRARTFIPLLPRRTPTTDLAVLMPLRDRVRRDAQGRLLGLTRWQRLVGEEGRLDRLGRLGAESTQPITWLVDPAVIEAVRSVAADNPPLFTGDDGTGPDEPDAADGGASDGGDGGGSPSAEPTPADGPVQEDEEGAELSPEATDAQTWLARFRAEITGDEVRALPYGDVDVAAVTTHQVGRMVQLAHRLSQQSLADAGIEGEPVVAPSPGVLPARSLARLQPEIPVVLGERAFPDADGPVLTRPDGTQVLLSDAAAAGGGPGPNPRTDALAMRQRILSEAALHALSEESGPLVVTLPARWDPGAQWARSGFFDGLQVPWLDQVTLGEALAGTLAETSDEKPFYPARQRRRQVPFANQLATRELVRTGQVYADLLTRNDSVEDDLARNALLGSSYAVRGRPGPALTRTRNTTLRIRRVMGGVDVDGPSFLMMSSETGPIAATVVNNLDEPVTVRIEAESLDPDLTISTPDSISLGPGQRAPVRLRAQSGSIGVHSVTLLATTENGDPIGSEVRFNVRTSNVGFVVWLIMGAGGALLAVMIVLRISRRVRSRGRGPEATPEPSAPAGTSGPGPVTASDTGPGTGPTTGPASADPGAAVPQTTPTTEPDQ